MKSVPKLIRRFVGILLFSSLLVIVLNIILLGIFVMDQDPNSRPWMTAGEAADALGQTEAAGYMLPDELAEELESANVWGILISDSTGEVVWKTDNLPETVPLSYTISDIAGLTRGYIDGYPAFTGASRDGLVVLGYPRDSFWKHMWPSWDYDTIVNLPKTFLCVAAVNIALIFVIYMTANTKLLNSVKPIVNGIQALPEKELVHIREKGLLSELAVNINKTSELLQSQSSQLRRRETARANWIAGVSHDIRTPLSMIMGYAGQLKDNGRLTEEERQKAVVIVKQSQRIRNLINDLNLASKLEYNMQPVHLRRENMVAIARQVAVDFMNMDIEGKYPIEWETDESLMHCPVNADKDLMKRAIENLIQNCISHNGQGCRIYVNVTAQDGRCTVAVADDGCGASDEQIEKLNNAPHYMVCDENTAEQRHGLGLLIVKQIMAAHGGTAVAGRGFRQGFSVELTLPLSESGV